MKEHQLNIGLPINLLEGKFVEGSSPPSILMQKTRPSFQLVPPEVYYDLESPSPFIAQMKESLGKDEHKVIEIDSVPEHLRGEESMSLVAEEIARMNRRQSLLAKTKMAAGMTPPETQPAIMKITQYGELQNVDGSTEVVSFELVAKP